MKKIIKIAVVISLLFGGLVYYFVFTNKGSDLIARLMLRDYVETPPVNIVKSTGTLSETLVYQNIEFHDLKWLPAGNVIKIQRLEISLDSFSLQGLNIKIMNGRVKFPNTETMLFQGTYQNGEMNFSAYTNEIAVTNILDLFAETSALKNIAGLFKDVDIDIKGTFLEPEIHGSFLLLKLSRDKFKMTDCPGKLDLKLSDIKDNIRINGNIVLEKGQISGPKTAIITVGESKISFQGDPENPSVEFRGSSIVENVNINILLKGSFEKPDLKITSKPTMDQDRLLLMLATNKTWKSFETALNKQELSIDIAKDFLDYFIFSGTGEMMAKKYGIRDISVKYSDSVTGVGATKDITSNTAVSYSVEQQHEKEKTPTISQKVGTEYAITKNVSISGEKEIKMNSEDPKTTENSKTDDKVMLKFKKEF